MIDMNRFTHLTFDCYGTLIDWESGILTALHRLLAPHGVDADDETLLRLYTRFEAEEEAGDYRAYREILASVADRTGSEFGVTLTPEERQVLPDSVGDWPPFDDTVEALRRLKERYKLVILSNIDDALFARTNRLLGIDFDGVVTAEQVRSYKPGRAHFEEGLRRTGAPVEQILHVAQSLYHDHIPAKAMGFATVWINRPSRLPNIGLSPRAEATPDLVLESMAQLAEKG